jgi:hypothetical protein
MLWYDASYRGTAIRPTHGFVFQLDEEARSFIPTTSTERGIPVQQWVALAMVVTFLHDFILWLQLASLKI